MAVSGPAHKIYEDAASAIRLARVRAQPVMRCAVADRFDLCDPADGFHRSPDRAGGYARAGSASGGGGASRVPRIAGDVTAGSALVSGVLAGYAPCAERLRF
jgi:hypothetical protein